MLIFYRASQRERKQMSTEQEINALFHKESGSTRPATKRYREVIVPLYLEWSKCNTRMKISEPQGVTPLRRGKAMRDFWTKEVGWWNKNARYCPEEFLDALTPDCFYELFQRYPITPLVRYWHDNHYSTWMFRYEMWERARGRERLQKGWELYNLDLYVEWCKNRAWWQRGWAWRVAIQLMSALLQLP